MNSHLISYNQQRKYSNNMKAALVFLSVIIPVLSGTLKEEMEKLEEIHEECQSDPATYADDKLLTHLSENLDNPQVEAHMLCEATKVGLENEDGTLNIDNIREKIEMCVEDKSQVDSLVEECAVEKESPGKTAVYLFMCLDKHNITYFHEF